MEVTLTLHSSSVKRRVASARKIAQDVGFASCILRRWRYNRHARMRSTSIIIAVMTAWGFLESSVVAASAAPESPPSAPTMTPQEVICRDFLQSVSDLWFLLSGISNRAEADAQAVPFRELVRRICLLDEQLSSSSTNSGLPVEVEAEVHEDAATAESAEMLDTLQLRILESFDDVNAEFLSLCRVQCYGSVKLAQAFEEAAETGMFAEDALMSLQGRKPVPSAGETEQELARRQKLEEPDRAVLTVLQQVKDASSAQKAVAALTQIAGRLRLLIPEKVWDNRSFSEGARARARAAYEPISPLLWGIRTELVRIAELPGYDTESFDTFSDALNNVFENIGATHSEWFDDVFDASFRSDLDDALRENTSSTY